MLCDKKKVLSFELFFTLRILCRCPFSLAGQNFPQRSRLITPNQRDAQCNLSRCSLTYREKSRHSLWQAARTLRKIVSDHLAKTKTDKDVGFSVKNSLRITQKISNDITFFCRTKYYIFYRGRILIY